MAVDIRIKIVVRAVIGPAAADAAAIFSPDYNIDAALLKGVKIRIRRRYGRGRDGNVARFFCLGKHRRDQGIATR